MKKCLKCGAIKDLSEFYKNTGAKDGYRNQCKDCKCLAGSLYRKSHPDSVRKSKSLWKNTNQTKVREYSRKSMARIRNTPKGRINIAISKRMNESLRLGVKSGRHWESLVDFTVEQLKKHLEKLFEPGMTWGNHGSYWHIDHKIPISAFNYEKPEDIDFKRCWSLKNLRPLEAIMNMKKHAKVDKPFQPSLKV